MGLDLGGGDRGSIALATLSIDSAILNIPWPAEMRHNLLESSVVGPVLLAHFCFSVGNSGAVTSLVSLGCVKE